MSESMAGGPGTRRRGQGGHGKAALRLRRVVEHPVRLAILACLDGEFLTLSQVGARIGKDEKRVDYHVKLLDSSGVVEKAGDGEGGGGLYVARLKQQPCWVARAVNERLLTEKQGDG